MKNEINPNIKYLLEHKYTKLLITLIVIFVTISFVVMLYMIFRINEITTIDYSKLPRM